MGRAYGEKLRNVTPAGLAACQAKVERDMAHRGEYEGRVVGMVFRIEAVRYAGCQLTEWGGEDYYVTDPQLEVFALPVARWTKLGATLFERTGARARWVNLQPGQKQYASRTVADALSAFQARRRAQIRILERQLARAKRELGLTYPTVSILPTPITAEELA